MRFSRFFTRLALALFLMTPPALGQVQRAVFKFSFGGTARWLKVEALRDDLLHFETFESPSGPGDRDAIWSSPMVDEKHYGEFIGPNFFQRNGDGLETSDIKVSVTADLRHITLYDKIRQVTLTTLVTEQLDQPIKSVHFDRQGIQDIYGVGNLFLNGKDADGDWNGKQWNARGHGNFRFGLDLGDNFYQGGPSVSQFPMIFAVGGPLRDGFTNYGLFFDQPYKMSWNFVDGDFDGIRGWTASMWGDQVRWYFMAGRDLPKIREAYSRLVGKPPVPPRSVFGHWTSKFGFQSWPEVEEEVASLRKNDFPLDGVALDLQWFGLEWSCGFGCGGNHRMGSLSFGDKWWTPNGDPKSPHTPKDWIKHFYDTYGIQFIPIEESYVDARRDDFNAMAYPDFRKSRIGFNGFPWEPYNASYLAERWDNGVLRPTFLTTKYQIPGSGQNDDEVWWGVGGMIDWSNPDARRYWHQLKRIHLSLMGITNHWLDLGEPEMYFEDSVYAGLPGINKHDHGSIHNLYNLFWAKGIDEGYSAPGNQDLLKGALSSFYGKELAAGPRHFTMSRAGTVGSHRYGGMWSGDVFGNMQNLHAHLQSQVHMSLLGVDYYSSDTGGFFHDGRRADNPEDQEIVKQWAAVSSLLDVPMRPHGWALEAKPEDRTTYRLDRRGDLDSNRANVRRRYELIPYLYSLAHRAHLFGEPVFPPLVYYFEGDQSARTRGNIKMIGPSLLFGVVAEEWQKTRQVDLPEGNWIDYESNLWYHGSPVIDLYRRERVPASELKDHPDRTFFLAPLFAREGAIIPRMHVDEHTMNAFGRRNDGTVRDELIVRVFASNNPTSFTLFEDDGISTAYENGQVEQTLLTQQVSGDTATVTIGAVSGHYKDAPENRENVIELVTDGLRADDVYLTSGGGSKIRCGTLEAFIRDTTVACWSHPGPRLIRAGTRKLPLDREKHFEFHLSR